MMEGLFRAIDLLFTYDAKETITGQCVFCSNIEEHSTDCPWIGLQYAAQKAYDEIQN